ncbi:MAG: L-2-hydroxyglutarate oxidase [Gemmatimonadota bacterium]|nr:L-2-hydroxyglutarate oxidase [Gemmatimonadota bacterium]
MRVAIVGGGIVGLATAYKLLQAKPDWTVSILEKEDALGQHQSGHNSGVLHAGLYYVPGSSKARLAVSGIRQMTAYARDRGIAHEICGKLVVAVDEGEVERLRMLEARGRQNGLAGIRWLTSGEIREFEPHCAGLAALHVPEEGIIDYSAVCRALQTDVLNGGGGIETGFEVSAITERASGWVLSNGRKEVTADFVIGCAGLQSDRVAALSGASRDVRIVPFRGEYFKLRPQALDLVRNLIYPVPDPVFPFLGVHFTRRIGGGVEAGPNAVLALSREGYGKWDLKVRDLWDALGYRGLRRFVRAHSRMCIAELRRSLSRHLFAESLRRLVPALRDEDLDAGGSGVRAQAMTAGGKLVQDFAFLQLRRALHVINAPSPAATASLAIADEIVQAVSLAKG